ncbi:MAG TPA: peptidoglycan-binding domain-containing protein [Alphaproteobacteria bacterium]|nr:peptidoglycan-binding domain-containing protein [Alphaproteobacteria bacterium]
MEQFRGRIGWLPLLLLTGCVMSQIAPSPGLDRLLTQGDIQVAEQHLRDFGFDPGPVDGIFTTQTQAAVRAFQARYGLPVSGLLDRATRQELLPGLDDWEVEPD